MSILHFPASEFRALAYIPRGSDQYATALKTMPDTTRPTISGCCRGECDRCRSPFNRSWAPLHHEAQRVSIFPASYRAGHIARRLWPAGTRSPVAAFRRKTVAGDRPAHTQCALPYRPQPGIPVTKNDGLHDCTTYAQRSDSDVTTTNICPRPSLGDAGCPSDSLFQPRVRSGSLRRYARECEPESLWKRVDVRSGLSKGRRHLQRGQGAGQCIFNGYVLRARLEVHLGLSRDW